MTSPQLRDPPPTRWDFLRETEMRWWDVRCKTLRPLPRAPGVPDRRDVVETILRVERDLRDMGVGSLHIFGSVARGDTHFDSDVDVAYTPSRKLEVDGECVLTNALEKLLRRKVDLIALPLTGPLRRHAEEDLVEVFA